MTNNIRSINKANPWAKLALAKQALSNNATFEECIAAGIMSTQEAYFIIHSNPDLVLKWQIIKAEVKRNNGKPLGFWKILRLALRGN